MEITAIVTATTCPICSLQLKQTSEQNFTGKSKRKKAEPRPLVYANLHRTNLRDWVRKQNGKFVTVDFIKQDGTPRTLNGRLGVTSYLAGGQDTVQREDRPYLTLFEVNGKGYRAVNLSTVSQLRADRQVLTIID